MSYLLDTNIISETIKKQPNLNLMTWIRSVPQSSLYISVLTIGEIQYGIEKTKDQKKKEELTLWLEHQMIEWFEDRVLSINADVTREWGKLSAQSQRTIPAVDSLISATAITYDLVLVTRNIKDFQLKGLNILNPFLP